MVKAYNFDDVVNTLNDVTPYDWRTFLNDRLNLVAPQSTLEAINKGGWRLVYTDKPNTLVRVGDHARKSVDLSYSIGALLKDDGTVMDVNPRLEAFKAGLGPGMKIMTVNGRAWSIDVLREALSAAKDNPAPIQLVIDNGSFTQTIQLNYHGGERYPHLERDPSKPDVISEIIKPLTSKAR